ncbi:hypothetical protein GETHLI_33870 [Geothrix limicola]|uniref:Helix-hairpin-helix DNA-binding motif class 1 domain-containing protein n=1 Tax=Geothrix limicola TaxID=2927978 RepID=A0ABQ5QLF2_9BACT|nr:helix-hairpin-helix domain-containing protein [Geothrix limicola]GLH74885.1 hypothetical protein GETHLI_33870 [Geothrix limicola]
MSNPFTTMALALALALPLAAAPAGTTRAPQRPINLNSAGVTELMQLPRIGQKTAERIIAFRKCRIQDSLRMISNGCDSPLRYANIQHHPIDPPLHKQLLITQLDQSHFVTSPIP